MNNEDFDEYIFDVGQEVVWIWDGNIYIIIATKETPYERQNLHAQHVPDGYDYVIVEKEIAPGFNEFKYVRHADLEPYTEN